MMMRDKRILIIKTGAAGDVIRTTALLHLFRGNSIDWFVSSSNAELLKIDVISNIISDCGVLQRRPKYDLVISLEDDRDVIHSVLSSIRYGELKGAYLKDGDIKYTADFCDWFDMSLISKHGIMNANRLKLMNRYSYQEHLYKGFGQPFRGEPYLLPKLTSQSDIEGDIAIAPQCGKRWPMKNWAYFENLIKELKNTYTVNILPERPSLREHIADIANHSLVISGDSLPMHLALGLNIPCIALFICTSPWEINDYGLLEKIVSPKLKQYFYRRDIVPSASTSIPLETVLNTVKNKLR